MALKELSLVQGEANKLRAFFIHTDEANKSFNGVNYTVNLDGDFADGTPKAVKASQLAYALGAGAGIEVGIDAIGSTTEGKEWAGAPAAFFLNGDQVSFIGKTAKVVVEAYDRNGKTGVIAKSVYRS